MTKEELEALAKELVDAILAVHRELGPGLLESSYQACLSHELRCRGIDVRCEVELPIRYRAVAVEVGYRIDMLVADAIIVENKAVQALVPIHEAQLLTYLRLSDKRVGFLVNWNVALIKDGLKRMVNRLGPAHPKRAATATGYLCALRALAVSVGTVTPRPPWGPGRVPDELTPQQLGWRMISR